jgi:predicted RNase H-like HicB family nuclease
MRYRLAVEDVEPNRWVAWVLDLPACFSSAHTEADAVNLAPESIAAHHRWLARHDSSLPVVSGPFEVGLVETFHSFASDEDPEYLVNAFFQDDRRPLAYWDVEVALRLLKWTHQDLLDVVGSVTLEQLSKPLAGETRGSIAGILEHVAGAENWYFEQLGMELDRTQLPGDPLGKLEVVRTNTRTRLVELIADERITRNCGELWSARKVVRRALWHERAHTQQIVRLRTQL